MRVARMLLASVRGPDLVARLGGDEFAILLRYTDEALAQTIVRRIEAAVAADHAPGEPPLVLAMGAATTRGELLDARRLELMRRCSRQNVFNGTIGKRRACRRLDSGQLVVVGAGKTWPATG